MLPAPSKRKIYNKKSKVNDLKKYKYQLHAHTSPCSYCSQLSPEELIDSLYEGGYQGVVITNHFFGGNTGIDRNLSWADFIQAYVDDYERLKKQAALYGMDVIFSVEEGFPTALEMLCYGVTPQLLLDHPEMKGASPKKWHDFLAANGCIAIQPHPYRRRDYIPHPEVLDLECIDGIEIYNYCNYEEDDRRAIDFCARHEGLILTSGGDCHNKRAVPFCGIEVTERILNEKDLVRILREGLYTLIKPPVFD